MDSELRLIEVCMKNNDVKEIVFYHCGNAEITCKFDNVIDGYRIVSIQGTTGVLVIPSAINNKYIKSIDVDVFFEEKNGISLIEVSDDNPFFVSIGGVLFSKDKSELILYPPNKKECDYYVPHGVAVIGENAILWNQYIKRIFIPETVNRIGNGALCCCKQLQEIHLPISIKYIGVEAFKWGDSIRNIYYAGSEFDWWNMEICEENNKLLYANMHYQCVFTAANEPLNIFNKMSIGNRVRIIKTPEEIIKRAYILYSFIHHFLNVNEQISELVLSLSSSFTKLEKYIVDDPRKNIHNRVVISDYIHQYSAMEMLLWTLGLSDVYERKEVINNYTNYEYFDNAISFDELRALSYSSNIRSEDRVNKAIVKESLLFWRVWLNDEFNKNNKRIYEQIVNSFDLETAQKAVELNCIDYNSFDLSVGDNEVKDIVNIYGLKVTTKWKYHAIKWLLSNKDWDEV